MTRENNNEQMEFPDTWEEFEEYYGFYDTNEVYTNKSRLIQSFRVKQWLEHHKQEPCDDAISRQAMLNVISELNALSFYEAQEDSKECYYEIRNAIKQLPSVVPQPKIGQWFIDERPENDRKVVCSNCDQPIFKYHKLDFDYRPKYCPNCGAKMKEDKE